MQSYGCCLAIRYLAPEIVGKESLTEKADVYAFGVVLLELLTGRKAIDRERPKGQQFLAEWARPVFHSQATGGASVDRLLDPRVDPDHSPRFSHQVNALFHAAAACLRRDPKTRPTMTQVLVRIVLISITFVLSFSIRSYILVMYSAACRSFGW